MIKERKECLRHNNNIFRIAKGMILEHEGLPNKLEDSVQLFLKGGLIFSTRYYKTYTTFLSHQGHP